VRRLAGEADAVIALVFSGERLGDPAALLAEFEAGVYDPA